MKNNFQFGETVEGYNIPVLNEREVRAAAGILFLLLFISLILIIEGNNFVLIKYSIILFLTDFMIRVFVSPRFSPTLILGRLIVSNQTPEYVGARQKKFAWWIGIVLAVTMFILMVIMNTYSIISGLICFVCLIFLFFESSFGICLGCKLYPLFFKDKVQYCPGEVCERKDRQPIQKTNKTQLLIVAGFFAYIFAITFLFNDYIKPMPHDLFGKVEPVENISQP